MANQGAQLQITPESAELIRGIVTSVIAEMKKPSEEELAKKEKERQDLLAKEKRALEAVKEKLAQEAFVRSACAHSRTLNGAVKHSWRGQRTTGDNLVHPVCVQCRTEWPPFRATPAMMSEPVDMEQMPLTKELLTEWHKKSFPEGCGKTRKCFICYPKELAAKQSA